jgi:predicted Rossmann fold flavoprotein
VFKSVQFDLPKRLWQQLVMASEIKEGKRWADLNRQQLESLTAQLTRAVFNVDGKSTFKEEFVTAGGVDLKEINFKTFESKLHPGLYFAGEVINVDAVTGGFNFQNAWTGAFIVAKSISEWNIRC